MPHDVVVTVRSISAAATPILDGNGVRHSLGSLIAEFGGYFFECEERGGTTVVMSLAPLRALDMDTTTVVLPCTDASPLPRAPSGPPPRIFR